MSCKDSDQSRGPSRFEAVDADGYERTHAGYAAEAIQWLVSATGLNDPVVVDLAAGTGKLTRRLAAETTRVLAVEPAENMLAKLTNVVPEALAIRGAAERIPLADWSVDCVTVGGSFHLFEPAQAVEEIARVLRTTGALAIFWKVYDMTAPIQVLMDTISMPYLRGRGHAIHRADSGWSEPILRSGHFAPYRMRVFTNDQTLRREDLGTVLATSTDIAWLPTAERRALLQEVGRVTRGFPEYVSLPGITEVHVFIKK